MLRLGLVCIYGSPTSYDHLFQFLYSLGGYKLQTPSFLLTSDLALLYLGSLEWTKS